MKGIDVSHHQGSIDFAKVKAAGIEVVIIKATEGKTYQDPLFKEHYERAKAAGLKIGFYHFLRANASEDEANNFLNTIKGLDYDCKLVIDAEVDLGGVEATSKKIRAFADMLTSKGMEAILYTGEYFYNNKINSSVKDIPLWVAKYSSNKPKVPCYIGWQYTSSGLVSGIRGRVDMNEFAEDILLSKLNPAPQTKPSNNSIPFKKEVLLFQKACNAMGITDEEGNRLDEDGRLGTHTKAAAKKAKAVVRRGDKNPLVGVIQAILKIKIDNSYGKAPFHETYDAIGKFQKSKGLKVDYSVGPITWIELLS